jgi:hypothetical protein
MHFLDCEMPLSHSSTSSLVSAVAKRRTMTKAKDKTFTRRATDRLIGDLESRSTRSFEDRIASARIVRELRERVEAGHMGEVTWYSWARKNIKLGKTRLKEHMRVANAANPRDEVKRLIELAEARAQRLDESRKRRDSVEWERRSVINFAKKAPIEQVRILQRTVSKMPLKLQRSFQ